MAGRQKALIPKNLNFPGPGTYDAKLEGMQNKAPQWTCAPRMKTGSLSHMNPGPGVYCPEKVRTNTLTNFILCSLRSFGCLSAFLKMY